MLNSWFINMMAGGDDREGGTGCNPLDMDKGLG